MSARRSTLFFVPLLAMVLPLALATGAAARTTNYIIMPLPPPITEPQPTLRAQPPLQWPLPIARGRMPGIPPPAARCYSGGTTCQMARSLEIGGPCTCNTSQGRMTGRALIPPSHDSRGRPVRTDVNAIEDGVNRAKAIPHTRYHSVRRLDTML